MAQPPSPPPAPTAAFQPARFSGADDHAQSDNVQSATANRNSVFDEQIADLFQVMGRATKLNRAQLAQQLSTSESVIEALELGALDRLPEWDEVSKVAAAYARFVNIDERPLLRRLREKLTEHMLKNMSHEGYRLQQTCEAMMPNSSASLKAFASGKQPLAQLAKTASPVACAQHGLSERGAMGTPLPGAPLHGWNQQSDQVFHSLSQQLQNGHMGQAAHHPFSQGGSPLNNQHMAMAVSNDNRKTPWWLKLVANVAFILILLFGFIQWQPNRFWSGVDQLPEPISSSIYSLFEYVIPDPLATTYRMNWVYVDDPRLRKADKLPVPKIKKLPALDFSTLGTLP